MGRATVRGRRAGQRCPYCHDRPPEGAWAECAGCGARLHVDCWREAGACASCRAPTSRLERRRAARWWPWLLALAVQVMVVTFVTLAAEPYPEQEPEQAADAALMETHLEVARAVVDDLERLVERERRTTATLLEREAALEAALARAGARDDHILRLVRLQRSLESEMPDLRAELSSMTEELRLYDRLIEDRLDDRCEPWGPPWARGEVLAEDGARWVVSLGAEHGLQVGDEAFVFRDGRLRALVRAERVRARSAVVRPVEVFARRAELARADTVMFLR